MSDPAPDVALCAQLNRGVRSKFARLSALPSLPFGEALTLHRFTLGNGLQIRIVPDGSAPVLSYHTWFRVGSRHERPGKTGLAHLFEHLMFNETKRLPYGEFDFRIESAGGESNASTWTDWTQYQAELPASQLGLIADMESQRMAELVLRAPQVRSEKEVVANERRQRVDDDVEGTAAEQLYLTAFRRHPYRIPTIGFMDDIEAFTPADCREFYRTYYAPNNAILVLVGDVSLPEALTTLRDAYGRLKPAKLPDEPGVTEPAQRAERVRELPWPTKAAKLLMGYRACAFGHRDYATLTVINDLLFGGRSGRLYRKLVREAECVSDLNGTIAPFEFPGLYEMWFALREGVSVQDTLALIDAEIARLSTERVDTDALERATHRLELGFWQSLETAAGKADQLGFYETVVGDGAQLFSRAAAYRAVTPQDVQRVAKQYLQAKKRTRIVVVPGAEGGADDAGPQAAADDAGPQAAAEGAD